MTFPNCPTKRDVEKAFRKRIDLNFEIFEEISAEYNWLLGLRDDIAALPEGQSDAAQRYRNILTKGG